MILHSKQENRPVKRAPKRDHITNELLTRERPELARATRRMKRHRPEDLSLKVFVEGTPDGDAWLKRKREAR